jgi:hypothetical protein
MLWQAHEYWAAGHLIFVILSEAKNPAFNPLALEGRELERG